MARAFKRAEIVTDVREIDHLGRWVILIRRPDPDDRHVREDVEISNPSGVELELSWEDLPVKDMLIGPKGQAPNKFAIELDNASMTCLITEYEQPADLPRARTRVRCSTNSNSMPLDAFLYGNYRSRFHMPGVLRKLDFDGFDTVMKAVHEDLGVNPEESLDVRHKVIQANSPKIEAENIDRFARVGFIRDILREHTDEEVRARIESEVRKNTETIPPVLYRKVNTQYLGYCLKRGGFVNSSGNNSFETLQRNQISHIVEDPNDPPIVSYSREYIDSCDLVTPTHRKEITIVMNPPENACAMHMKYNPAGTDVGNEQVLYNIEAARCMEKKSGCECINEEFVTFNAQTNSWHGEKEVVATECNSGIIHFKPDDIVSLVVETQCGVDFDKTVETFENLDLHEYIPKLVRYEDWAKEHPAPSV